MMVTLRPLKRTLCSLSFVLIGVITTKKEISAACACNFCVSKPFDISITCIFCSHGERCGVPCSRTASINVGWVQGLCKDGHRMRKRRDRSEKKRHRPRQETRPHTTSKLLSTLEPLSGLRSPIDCAVSPTFLYLPVCAFVFCPSPLLFFSSILHSHPFHTRKNQGIASSHYHLYIVHYIQQQSTTRRNKARTHTLQQPSRHPKSQPTHHGRDLASSCNSQGSFSQATPSHRRRPCPRLRLRLHRRQRSRRSFRPHRHRVPL